MLFCDVSHTCIRCSSVFFLSVLPLCAVQANKASYASSTVPAEPSWTSELLALWTQLETDTLHVYSQHKHVVLAVYGIGFAAGVLCCGVLWLLLSREEAKIAAEAKKND